MWDIIKENEEWHDRREDEARKMWDDIFKDTPRNDDGTIPLDDALKALEAAGFRNAEVMETA